MSEERVEHEERDRKTCLAITIDSAYDHEFHGNELTMHCPRCRKRIAVRLDPVEEGSKN